MVDFVQATFAARLPRVIRAGTLVKFTDEGKLEWETSTRLTVEGSHDSSVQIRACSPHVLEVSGNLAKFLQGHNLFGPDDLGALVRAFFERIQPKLWPEGMPWIDVPGGQLSRVDVTSGFLMDTRADVTAWLRAADERGRVDRVGQGKLYVDERTKSAATLVYGDATGKRAKNWQLTFYSKGIEVRRHLLPEPMRYRPDVLEWVDRLLRCEVRLRRGELRRIGLVDVAEWTPERVASEWQEKLDRLQLSEGQVMMCSDFEGVKPRLLDCYDAWQAGRDLRIGRKDRAFYRLRAEMREVFGVDIANTCPKSNVVPLRRAVVATPAQRPPWADEIAALLAA